MADLTKEIPLSGDWIEISRTPTNARPLGLDLAVGVEHRVEVARAQSDCRVRLAETDDGQPPTTVGHQILPASRARSIDRLVYTRPAGSRLWARASHGVALLTATPTATP